MDAFYVFCYIVYKVGDTMEKLKAKDFLKQIRKIEAMIGDKVDEVEKWKSIAMSITTKTNGERVQSSGSKEKMADAVGSYVDIENEMIAQVAELQKKKLEILSVIDKLEITEYELLREVYVNGKTLEEYAEDIGKTERWAYTVHGIALKNVQKIIERSYDIA